jgi:hypothetical protein
LTSVRPDRYESKHRIAVFARSPVAPAFSQGVNQMSIVRVGSSTPYAAGWDHIFGGANGSRAAKHGAKKAGSKKTVSKQPVGKKAAKASESGSVAAAGKSKAKAPTARAAKNKPGRAKK